MTLIAIFRHAKALVVPAVMLSTTPALGQPVYDRVTAPNLNSGVDKIKAFVESYISPKSPTIFDIGTLHFFSDGQKTHKNVERDCNFGAKADATAVTKLSLGVVSLSCPALKPHGKYASCVTQMRQTSVHLLTKPTTSGEVDVVCPKEPQLNETVMFIMSGQTFAKCGVAIANNGERLPKIVGYELRDPSFSYSLRQREMGVPSICAGVVQPN